MIDVLMPLKHDNSVIPSPVLAALLKQECNFVLYIDASPDIHGYEFRETVCQNICDKRNRLKKRCKSEFIFWLDTDVVIPTNSFFLLRYELCRNKQIGIIGIKYAHHPSNLHVALGATMMRRKVLLSTPPFRHRISQEKIPFCECVVLGCDLTLMRYKVFYHPHLRAVHLKWKKLDLLNPFRIIKKEPEFELTRNELERLTNRGTLSLRIEVI